MLEGKSVYSCSQTQRTGEKEFHTEGWDAIIKVIKVGHTLYEPNLQDIHSVALDAHNANVSKPFLFSHLHTPDQWLGEVGMLVGFRKAAQFQH